MHLFSRVATLGGGPVRGLEWATEITARVNAVGDVETSLWSASFGYPGGTVAWSTIVESRAQLAEQFAKIGADGDFLALAEKGLEFNAGIPFQDTLRSIVHMTREPTGEGPPAGAVAELITTVAGEGKLGAAMAWGVEIADMASGIADAGAAFMVDDYGTFGQMTWVVIYDDPAACDAANAALMGNEEYLAALDKAGADGLFVTGSGTRGALTRVA